MRRVLIVLALLISCGPLVGRAQTSSTATGISRNMNPAISVNGLFLGQVSRDSDTSELNKIDLQEAEAQFTSIVDPFWRAHLTFAVHPANAHAHGEAGPLEQGQAAEGAEAAGVELDVEEAYIDGRSLPGGFALRLGKFYLPFGKHVPLHTHQFPFVKAPVVIETFLGGHGLTEAGAQLAYAPPTPWFSDLVFYGVDGRAEIFDAENRDLVFGGRLKNLFDLSDEATLELGGSFFNGPDAAHPGEGRDLNAYGLDLTYKWISSVTSKGPAATLGGELILPDYEESTGDPSGWYVFAQYRVHRNWWLGAMHGRANRNISESHAEPLFKQEDEEEAHAHEGWNDVFEYKFNVAFAPSEFSALRAEVCYYDDRAGDADDLRFMLQWNFTIGSHPAHLY